MSRYTSAYSEFIRQLREVEVLRRAAAKKERDDPISFKDEINALCRGSVVLLSAHLEAYVRRLGELALDSMSVRSVPRTTVVPQMFYHMSQDLLADVRRAEAPEKVAERVFAFLQSDLPLWSKTGPFPEPISVDRFNRGFANPAFRRVKKYFRRFGYSDYGGDLAVRLGGDFLPTTNMVDQLVDARNKIAHGDPTASKTPAEVSEMIRLIRLFSSTTDAAFASWWRARFCSIR